MLKTHSTADAADFMEFCLDFSSLLLFIWTWLGCETYYRGMRSGETVGCCWSQRWTFVWTEKSLYNSNEARSSGFRLLTEDSNMPEVNYLLSVSWGYIKVRLWVINRHTLFAMYWLFNLDVAWVSCIACLKCTVMTGSSCNEKKYL